MVPDADGSGRVNMMPVSTEHPLSMCQHWVTATKVEDIEVQSGNTISQFYSRLGIAILGTVCDGDCGLDSMHQMLGETSCPQSRRALRQELFEYLLYRIETPWMHDVLLASQEISKDDLELYRAAAPHVQPPRPPPSEPPAVAPAAHSPTPTPPPPTGARSPDTADGDAIVAAPAPSDGNAVVAAESAQLIFKALSWSLSTKEEGILVHVARSLPKAALDEQIRAYLCEQERATTTLAVPNTTLAVPNAKVVAPVAVNVNHLKSRMQVAALYDKYLEDMGCKACRECPGARSRPSPSNMCLGEMTCAR